MKKLLFLFLSLAVVSSARAQAPVGTFHFVVKETVAQPVTLRIGNETYSFSDHYVLKIGSTPEEQVPDDKNVKKQPTSKKKKSASKNSAQKKNAAAEQGAKKKAEQARKAADARAAYMAHQQRNGPSQNIYEDEMPESTIESPAIQGTLADVRITDINGYPVVVPEPVEMDGEYWVILSQRTGASDLLKGPGNYGFNDRVSIDKRDFWSKKQNPESSGWWIDAAAGYGMLYGGAYGLGVDAYIGDRDFMFGLLLGLGRDKRITEGSKTSAYIGLSMGLPSLLGLDLQLGGVKRHYPEYEKAKWGLALGTDIQYDFYGPFGIRAGIGYTLYGHGKHPNVNFEWNVGIVVRLSQDD